MSNKYKMIDLFAGCGGLEDGFLQSGKYEDVAAVEWLKPQVNTLIKRLETKWKVKDAKERVMHFDIQREKELFEGWQDDEFGQGKGLDYFVNKVGGIDIIIGGPPCQAYSVAGRVRDENGMRDDYRNYLFEHYLNVVNRYRPKLFVFENVPGILSAAPDGTPITDLIRKGFEKIGYEIIKDLRVAKVNASDYSVPQNRERMIIVGVDAQRYSNIQVFLKEFYSNILLEYRGNKVFTVRDAIGDLEDDPGDYFTGSYSTIFMSRNRKKLWSQPSFTIQASGRQAPIHPAGAPMEHVGKDRYVFSDGEENNRRLSVKEIARIQTFPDWYEFSRGTSNRNDNAKLDLVYKQIGNAVPVRLALAVAEPIAEFARTQLEQEKEDTKYVIVHETEKRMMA